MFDALTRAPGRELDHDAYSDDFDVEYDRLTGDLWKLERHQTFAEVDDPGWQALVAGDWDRAMALNTAEEPDVREVVTTDLARGLHVRRVRIVQRPISPYVQWEMHHLRLRVEAGEPHRVLDATAVRDAETAGELPELLVFGNRLVYQLRYVDGALAGARRVDDPAAVVATGRHLAALYERAEPLLDFFDREVVPLPAPRHAGMPR